MAYMRADPTSERSFEEDEKDAEDADEGNGEGSSKKEEPEKIPESTLKVEVQVGRSNAMLERRLIYFVKGALQAHFLDQVSVLVIRFGT